MDLAGGTLLTINISPSFLTRWRMLGILNVSLRIPSVTNVPNLEIIRKIMQEHVNFKHISTFLSAKDWGSLWFNETNTQFKWAFVPLGV